jgi:hypothetical protein
VTPRRPRARYKNDPWFDTRWGVQLGTVANMLRDLPRAVRDAELHVGGTVPTEAAEAQ